MDILWNGYSSTCNLVLTTSRGQVNTAPIVPLTLKDLQKQKQLLCINAKG